MGKNGRRKKTQRQTMVHKNTTQKIRNLATRILFEIVCALGSSGRDFSFKLFYWHPSCYW